MPVIALSQFVHGHHYSMITYIHNVFFCILMRATGVNDKVEQISEQNFMLIKCVDDGQSTTPGRTS